MKRRVGSLFIAGGFVFALACAGHAAAAAEPFKLTSPEYQDNAVLSVKNAGNNKASPNCVGDNDLAAARLGEPTRRHQ